MKFTLNPSQRAGIGFGLISGVGTALGLVVGLHSSTEDRRSIIGALLILSMTNSVHDAHGVEISRYFENQMDIAESRRLAWLTFVSEFLITLSFILPLIVFELHTAVMINVLWGLSVIAILGYLIAAERKQNPIHVMMSQTGELILMLLFSHYIGVIVNRYMKQN
jgi:vacuolar iron transporter family protein